MCSCTVPGPVSGLSATPGVVQLTISWTAPSELNGVITMYQVTRNSTGVLNYTNPSATQLTRRDLPPNTAVEYSVRAYTIIGPGDTVSGIASTTDIRKLITRCAYAQGRVKRLSPSIYLFVCLFVCVSSKNTAVCCLTARKSPRNSSLPLGLAIYILLKMPRKPDESSVECYGHGFLIAARPRGV